MLKIQNIIRAGILRHKTKNPVQMPGFLIKNLGASKVLRWQRHLASQLAPLLQNQKKRPFGRSF